MIVGISTLTILLSVRSWYKPTIKLNEPSPVTIILDKDVEVIDRIATNDAKEKARLTALRYAGDKDILEIDQSAFKTNLENLKFIVHFIRDEISISKPSPDPINPKVSLETQLYLLEIDDVKFNQVILSTNLSELIDDPNKVIEIYALTEIEKKLFFKSLAEERDKKKRIEEEKAALGKQFFDTIRRVDYESIFVKAFAVQKKILDLGYVRGFSRTKMHENIKILYPGLSYVELSLIESLIDRSTFPNMEIDWKKLREIEKDAMNAVTPVTVELKQGSLMASKGRVVTLESFYYLSDLEMLHAKPDWKEISNNFVLITCAVVLIILFNLITKFKHYSVQQIIMMFLIPIAASAIIAPIAIWGVYKLPLVPLAAVSILMTIFYSPSMAGIVILLMSFFMAKTVDMNFWQVLPHFVGSIYAIFLVRKVHQREDLTSAGTKIAVVQVVVFLLTVMLAVGDFEVTTVLIIASFYAISAVGSGFISLAALPYFESGLQLLTPFKLAELANPNQPLLKKLKEMAPGTYAHSINVSRLSEEAGAVLGLNTDLIRVGLLYHDIGKVYAPDYFIENTLGKPNPHTTLDDPKKSAEIILAHIPEGIKLARKYNLPQEIADFIPMHQGTTITNYFYYMAIEKYGKKQVNPEDYRYPGPRPNTKETGVAMLADSTEAALRSIKDIADEKQASEMIYKIINARIDEGELASTGLTRSDLDKVAGSFLNIWRSQNHERVKYPS